jgi:hypothetical protein
MIDQQTPDVISEMDKKTEEEKAREDFNILLDYLKIEAKKRHVQEAIKAWVGTLSYMAGMLTFIMLCSWGIAWLLKRILIILGVL